MTFASPSLKFVAFLLFCSTASIASAQNSAPDPSGTWRWEYELDGKTREDSLVLNLVDGKRVPLLEVALALDYPPVELIQSCGDAGDQLTTARKGQHAGHAQQ